MLFQIGLRSYYSAVKSKILIFCLNILDNITTVYLDTTADYIRCLYTIVEHKQKVCEIYRSSLHIFTILNFSVVFTRISVQSTNLLGVSLRVQ